MVFHCRFQARRRPTTARVNSAWQSAQRPRPAPRNLSARSLPSAPPPPPPPRTAGRPPSRSGGSSSAGRRRFWPISSRLWIAPTNEISLQPKKMLPLPWKKNCACASQLLEVGRRGGGGGGAVISTVIVRVTIEFIMGLQKPVTPWNRTYKYDLPCIPLSGLICF